MLTAYAIKLGDTRPSLSCILKAASGSPSNLTGYTGMKCHVRRADDPTTTLLERDTVIVDAVGGSVRVDWTDGDTETLGVGLMEAEFKVLATGEPITWPSEGYVAFRVWDEIEGAGS